MGIDEIRMNNKNKSEDITKIYSDEDTSLDILRGAEIVVIGFGTQGTSRAMNMRDSGLKVTVGSDPGHDDWKRAEAEGFPVLSMEEAAAKADMIELEIPDMAYRCAEAYNQRIRPNAREHHAVCLSSALNYYYGHMDLPAGADALVTAAKAPGSAVRTEFTAGRGAPALLGVHQDGTGRAWERGLALCRAMGFTRGGVKRTTVEEETVTDLLGEHCAWGAIVELLKTVYEVMTEAGYDPDVAFYEAVNESKLTTDLIYKYGMAGMLERISNTAAFGAMTIGPKIIDENVKEKIRWAMENIKNGGFDREWKKDFEEGYPQYQRMLEDIRNHPADVVGNRIREKAGRVQKGDFSITNPLS